MNVKELYGIGNNLFSKRMALVSLWQEISDNFYPERADFTLRRSIGNDFASNLMTSYPVMCRRDLGNQFGTMLRPTAKPWFHIQRRYIENEDNEVQRYLERFEKVQRRAMYDPISMFTRATKEGDHDFAAFGQCVISVEVNSDSKYGQHLLYRCWHLRDVAWQENAAGQVAYVFRKWKPTVHTLCSTFKNVDPKITKINEKTPFEEIEVMHMIVDAEMFDDDAKGKPRWSIWYDFTNDHIMEAKPIWGKHYIIPRWQTVSNSQYSYSPATVAALPDARLIQAMTFTLLEAGEKATSPPMVATIDAVRSDVNLFAGGITWIDQEYDERLGEALRPLNQDFRGFNFGTAMVQDTRGLIREAFYLNTLSMPQRSAEMTAYEVGQRVQEYIRNALPIFEPLEAEYNAALCDETFDLLAKNGAFGSPNDWPKELRGAGVEFTFESPLHDAIDQQKGHKILEVKTLLADAIALDPSTAMILDAKAALRDALSGIQTPATWIRPESEVEAMEKQQQEAMQAQQMLSGMEQASKVAGNLASAQKDQSTAPMPMPTPGSQPAGVPA
jgi:hypothetical protein